MTVKPSLIPICKVPALIEAWYGWRPHEMTVYRWMQGVHGGSHKLKTIKRGSRRLTSRGELRRFMKDWNPPEQGGIIKRHVSSDREKKVGTKEHQRAVEALKKMGMKF